ncbi:MAG: zinc-ribbon domain-containing protein [Thermoplasmata archaeon]|nr:zinc ribbon domain-containing protein [Thermoplasmata archaeon]NIS10946.1 zinc ribbon domain-containing protein [Thermoplasmata archaeon]NIS18882.1 zinc ribbon domain-containing protein [Thermoplasmata archaeon]NIT75916.1 zinc ribbon domain-containing protein [Thermoplasmata archaeon]NIU48036.1 zinc ribbon domain-containing protein [Thermoplasmata archaeon]
MYCTRCGTKNEEDAAFCKKCGNNLHGASSGPVPAGPPPHAHGKSKEEDDCERDCHGSNRSNAIWWGIIVIIIGAWFIWEFALKDVVDAPDWMSDDIFCTAIWIMVGIAIIAAGIRMLMRKTGHK